MNLKAGTVEVEADMETVSSAFFSPFPNTVYEWVEWMWRMSKQSGVDVEDERAEWMWRISEEEVYLRLQKKILLCVFVFYG